MQVGGNGRRTSHNPPDPRLLDIYDRVGVVVMDENRLFDNNTADVNNMGALVKRDRNHPAVIIWVSRPTTPAMNIPASSTPATSIVIHPYYMYPCAGHPHYVTSMVLLGGCSLSATRQAAKEAMKAGARDSKRSPLTSTGAGQFLPICSLSTICSPTRSTCRDSHTRSELYMYGHQV